jgi:hypothetical protein
VTARELVDGRARLLMHDKEGKVLLFLLTPTQWRAILAASSREVRQMAGLG